MTSWRFAILVGLVMVVTAGCSGSDAEKYTPMPYGVDEGFWPIVGKTLVNLPVWGLEAAFAAAVMVFWAWLQAGAPMR